MNRKRKIWKKRDKIEIIMKCKKTKKNKSENIIKKGKKKSEDGL